jgi:hypothetical protein
VNYIKELLNKVNEKESLKEFTPLTACETGMETDISEPDFIPVKTFASTPTGASLRKTSCVMDAAVQTTSESELVTTEEEELLVSPEEEMELLASGDEEEEIPEFNSIEDFRKWLEL